MATRSRIHAISLFIAMTCAVGVSSATEHPNVLVILTDDQGWGDLSLNGNGNLQTPHVDSLAKDGASFERFFVCPVCSPTRAEFLTGRYHTRGGVYSTSTGGERLDLDEQTIAETFKAAGYRTAAFGKWHNGMQYPYHPNGRGFDDYYGFCSGHWGHYFSPMLEHNGRLVQGNGYLIDDFTDHAINVIQQESAKPFFVYLPFCTPHSPMQVPDKWWDEFADKDLSQRHRDPQKEDIVHTRAALAMCENIDWNVGRLLQTLDDMNLAENTIVVYFCDNGPNGWRWNGDMKGRKGSTDEGGVRSPLLVRWPGMIKAGTVVTGIAGAIDLLPTLADLADIPVISKQPLDGVSQREALLGESASQSSRRVFSHWNKKVSVRTQQYRLDHEGQLFDLTNDPGQRHDVSDEHPELAKQLCGEVAKWKEEMLPGLRDDERPFTVGHPDYRYTQLPARDATASGDITRSSRHPNCSFFSNWTRLDEAITWDVEVLAGGQYDVEVYYTCPKQDVGSTVELSFGRNRLTGIVMQAHDPPLVGAAADRHERSESYVKDFRPLKLGTITLEPGHGTLTLKALEIPGKQVMDMRLIMLTRNQ